MGYVDNMLSIERQRKLDPILKAIQALPGVRRVWQDDFDSTAINVFVALKPAHTGLPILQWDTPLRTVKAGIKKACGERSYNFLHQPEKVYSWSPAAPGIPRVCYDDGYDCDYIKLEVFV